MEQLVGKTYISSSVAKVYQNSKLKIKIILINVKNIPCVLTAERVMILHTEINQIDRSTISMTRFVLILL